MRVSAERSEVTDEFVLVAETRTVIKGPSVGKVKVKLRKKKRPIGASSSNEKPLEGLFVESEIVTGGAQVVGGFLEDIVGLDLRGSWLENYW